jgi:nucleotide-binding universal stress UspA family protein
MSPTDFQLKEPPMSASYIIGYDGTDAAKAAIDFAAVLAKANGASLTAVCAYPPVPRVYGRGAADGADAELTALAEADAALAMADLHDSAVAQRLVRPGSPPKALSDAADDQSATMIVVGTTDRGPLGRISPGSTAERLLHGAPCPVAVVPATRVNREMKAIAVAYDGGAESEAAVTCAAELAESLGASLELLGVDTPIAMAGPMASGFDTQLIRDGLEKQLGERAAAAGATWRLVTGSAGSSLSGVSAEYDLMVAGSRGYGPLRAVLMGSVSRHLADHAACPVIIAPRPEHAPVAATTPPREAVVT